MWGLEDGSTFISGITKQVVTVADHHAVAEVILWEENVGKLQQQGSSTSIQEYVCSGLQCSKCLHRWCGNWSLHSEAREEKLLQYERLLDTVHTAEPPVYEKDIRVVSSLYEMQSPCQATVASFWKVLQVRVRDDAAF